MDEDYIFLKKYVTPTSDATVSNIEEKVERTRQEIIKTHRTMVLLSMVEEDFDKFQSFEQKKKKLERFVIDPKEGQAPKVSPQLIQQSSHLFSLLHTKTPELLDALLEVNDQEEFYTLIHSSIPSLFGYFSSPEHLQLAFSFYMRVLGVKNRTKRDAILYPFFDSPVVSRFVESVYQPFFERFNHDTRYEKEKWKRKEIINIFVKDLIALIKESTVLLHSCHAVIMKFMIKQWREKEACEFIIGKWLRAQAFRWLNASGYSSKEKFLDDIFKTIMSDKKLYREVLDVLCDANPQFELPDMYTTFDQLYLLFYSSFKDLSLLAKVIQSKCTLSPSMSIFFNGNHAKHCMFFFRIFPKRPMPKPFSLRPMVFRFDIKEIEEDQEYERIWRQIESSAAEAEMEPFDFLNSDKMKSYRNSLGEGFLKYAHTLSFNNLVTSSKNFEKLLNYNLSLSMIQNWNSISKFYLEKHLKAYAVSVVIPSVFKSKTDKDPYTEASSLFYNLNSIKKTIFFAIIERKIPKLLWHYKKSFNELGALWKNAVSSFGLESSEDIGLVSEVASKMFFEASERLMDIDAESLMTSFTSILSNIDMFEKAAEFDGIKTNLFAAAVTVNPPPLLPHLYIIINEFAMKNSTFTSLLTDHEEKAWVSFESSLLKMIVRDQKLVSVFFPLQESISSVKF